MKTPYGFGRSTRFTSHLRIVTASTLILTAAAMALFAAKPRSSGGGSDNLKNGVYIVQMLASPAASYTGDVPGYPATKPKKGEKIDPSTPDTVRYASYLKGKHDAALRKVGGGAKIHDYAISYNGFAAKLTAKQAAALAKQKDVLKVTEDELVNQDTSSTPHFLGLDAPGGLWAQLGGPTAGKQGVGAGENIVIGVVDSGIWPDSKSFADHSATGQLLYQSIAGRHGRCEDSSTDGSWNSDNCNKKLIWARHFNAAWGGDAGIQSQRPWEFLSPRDYNGHGTHTTSTAGGNNGVQPIGPAASFGPISGMAPRARVAAYKALWSTQDGSTASGFNSDLVAAIDQAVADGVDVINYSISGTTTNFLDPVQVSFLFAADAGVFVSASAGNSGPASSTVAHPGPWLTTVAAGTHNRSLIGTVTLGNNAVYTGASAATSAAGPAPIINSTAAGLSGANPTAVKQCFTADDNVAFGTGTGPVLDPAKVTGKIVVCERGNNARVAKSLAVQQAGGIGMVLVNVTPNTLNADFHSVPTVHLADTDRAAVEAYAATAGATATVSKGTPNFSTPAPFTADFSSRGPLLAGGGDLLKPDVIAPGVDVLAAVAPTAAQGGLNFNLLSGTSMSAPHVAGVGALLMQLHPNWTPAMIKSALMTSGYDVLDTSISDATRIFRQGAGHITPNSAANPGLVYNNTINDWFAFLCGTTNGVSPSTCNALVGAGYSLDPSDLNVASIAIGDMAGAQTVKRKVTNVGNAAATYTPSTTGLSGITASFTPTSLTLNPGQTGTYMVTFTRTTAPLNTYTGGQLTWSGGGHAVRIPVVIRPVALAAPAEVTGPASGFGYSVRAGYAGTLNFAARGLVAATATAKTVAQDPDQTFNPADPTGTIHEDIVVPAGLKLFRVGIDEGFITPSGTDLDVYVYRGGLLVGQSADGDSNEMVTFSDPPAGTYTVYVHGFNTNGPSANLTLFSWQLASTSAGNMTVPGPASTTTGGNVPVNLSFTGLTPSTWYLGQVIYNDGTSDIGSTIVNVK